MREYRARTIHGVTVRVAGHYQQGGHGAVVLGCDERTHTFNLIEARRLVIGVLNALSDALGEGGAGDA